MWVWWSLTHLEPLTVIDDLCKRTSRGQAFNGIVAHWWDLWFWEKRREGGMDLWLHPKLLSATTSSTPSILKLYSQSFPACGWPTLSRVLPLNWEDEQRKSWVENQKENKTSKSPVPFPDTKLHGGHPREPQDLRQTLQWVRVQLRVLHGESHCHTWEVTPGNKPHKIP